MQSRVSQITYLKVLVMVRAFYLDLAEWALEEPERWASWASPCPVQAHELKGHSKVSRRITARLHARTRTLAPLLPDLDRSAREWMKDAQLLLAMAQSLDVGEEFRLDSRSYRRLGRPAAPVRRSSCASSSTMNAGSTCRGSRRMLSGPGPSSRSCG